MIIISIAAIVIWVVGIVFLYVYWKQYLLDPLWYMFPCGTLTDFFYWWIDRNPYTFLFFVAANGIFLVYLLWYIV